MRINCCFPGANEKKRLFFFAVLIFILSFFSAAAAVEILLFENFGGACDFCAQLRPPHRLDAIKQLSFSVYFWLNLTQIHFLRQGRATPRLCAPFRSSRVLFYHDVIAFAVFNKQKTLRVENFNHLRRSEAILFTSILDTFREGIDH
jgi:hypothetical protein